MSDKEKTRVELVSELEELHLRVASLEDLERELKRTIQRLQECEMRHQSLLDSSPDAMVVYDPRGYVLYANAAFTRTFGWSGEEILGRRIDYVPEEFLAQTQDTLKRLLNGEQVPSFDTKRLTKDGRVLDIHISSALVRGAGGEPASHIVTLRDITSKKKAEEALRENQKTLQTILETSPVGISLARNRTIEWTNKTYRDLFGFDSEDDIVGKHSRFLCETEEDYQRVGAVYEELKDGSAQGLDSRWKRKDGSVFPGHLMLKAIDPADPLAGVICAFSDLSSRERVERDLRLERSRLQALLELNDLADESLQTITDFALEKAVELTGSDVGYLAFANEDETVLTMHSFSRKGLELCRINDKPLVYPVERTGLWGEAVRQRKPIITNSYAAPNPLKKGYPDGHVELIRHMNIPVFDGAKIALVAGVGNKLEDYDDADLRQLTLLMQGMWNLIQRKTVLEEVRRSQERFRTIFDNAAVGIDVLDNDGCFTDANSLICQMLGYSPEEMATVTNSDITHPDDAHTLDMFADLRDGKVDSFQVERRYVRKDGSVFWGNLWASAIRDKEGKPESSVGITVDITDKKILQRQLLEAQKMEAIGTLAGGISHDFNNLLQIILGYTELLMLDENKNRPGNRELQAIRSAATRGADLVRGLLTFSRKVETAFRPRNLNHEVKRAATLLDRTIPKMIEIHVLLAHDLKPVNADSSQIQQILLNLAVNAKDAMPDGGNLVFETQNVYLKEEYCRAHLDLQPGDYVRLSVSDTGRGMEKDVLERIFEPFYTTKKPGEGTGLGLSMVFGIVKMHRGHIVCVSEPGKGATFNIYFPAIESEVQADPAASAVMPAFGTETILLVDDEDLIRDLGKKILSWAGYGVLTASNGQEAIERYRANQATISLVILDLVMPGMGGKQCLMELLKIDPAVTVLIASGFSVDAPTKQTLEARAKGFVTKPYTMKEMLRSVRRVLDQG